MRSVHQQRRQLGLRLVYLIFSKIRFLSFAVTKEIINSSKTKASRLLYIILAITLATLNQHSIWSADYNWLKSQEINRRVISPLALGFQEVLRNFWRASVELKMFLADWSEYCSQKHIICFMVIIQACYSKRANIKLCGKMFISEYDIRRGAARMRPKRPEPHSWKPTALEAEPELCHFYDGSAALNVMNAVTGT